MRTLCVILDADTEAHELVDRVPPRDQIDVLVFTPGGEINAYWGRALAGAKFLDVRSRYRAILPSARDRFTRFVAEWPEHFRVGRQSFKQWLSRDGLSRWWLVEFSQKNPESSPVFNTYCSAEILRRELQSGLVAQVFIVGSDPWAVRSFSRVCEKAGVAVSCFGMQSRFKDTWLGLLALRMRAAQTALRRMRLAGRRPVVPASLHRAPEHGRFAVHSWFPVQWTNWKGKYRDRYFVDLPDALQSAGGEVFYACSFYGLRYSELGRVATALDSLPTSLSSQMVWIEADMPWLKIAQIFLDLRDWLRFESLNLIDNRVAKSLAEELDVDLSPLLLHDLRMSLIVQQPEYLLLAEQMRRFTLHYHPTHVLTILETYCYGRALTWGVHSAGVGARVVGLQHSPANANQIFYRYMSEETTGTHPLPLPDSFLLHSQMALTMLQEAGIASERLHLVGAPRFALLADYRRKRQDCRDEMRRELGLPQAGRLILVAGVLWPTETNRFLRWAFEAAAQLPGAMLLIKPHPMNQHIMETCTDLAKEFPVVKWQQVDYPLNVLQAVADVMVTGNSSSDVESLAIGCPVIKAATLGLGTSPTDDLPGSVIEVGSAEELRQSLSSVKSVEGELPGVKWALGPVDESVNERIVQILLNM